MTSIGKNSVLVLTIVLVFSLPIVVQGGARCGACWGDANANPASCKKQCSYNSQCSGGEQCFGGLWDDVCRINFDDADHQCPTLPSEWKSSTSSTHSTLTASMLGNIMGDIPGVNYDLHYGHLVDTMNDYEINTPMRMAHFLGQVAHETNGLCTLWQPVDNGAGDLHMLPSNFRVFCRRDSEVRAAFERVFCPGGKCAAGVDPCCQGSDYCAGEVIALPKFAHRSAAWWLTEGSALANGLCGDMRIQMDCGAQGVNLITNCIYGFGGANAGLAQRKQYFNTAVSKLGATGDSSKCSSSGVSVNFDKSGCAAVPSPPSPPSPTGSSGGSCSKGQGGSTRCGTSWSNANGNCGCTCANDGDCPTGQKCSADLNTAPCGSGGNPNPPASPPVVTCTLGLGKGTGARCGAGWSAANNKCGCACSNDGHCPSGEKCYGGMSKGCTGGGAAEEGSKEGSSTSSSSFPMGAVVVIVVCAVIMAVASIVVAVVIVKGRSSTPKRTPNYTKMVEDREGEMQESTV